MQLRLLLFSDDDYFLNQVADYIARTQKEFQIIVYNKREKAVEYIEHNSNDIDIILADKDFFECIHSDKSIRIVIDSKTELSEKDGYYKLNIYQQAENLVRDLKKMCVNKNQVQISDNKDSKIVSYFSTQGGAGQSTIAYQLAANLSMEYKVLYISFDYINVYQTKYMTEYPVEMAQIMFNIKDRKIIPENIYQAITRNQHGVYVLPPFHTIGDITELTKDDIAFLLEHVKKIGEFDYIFLDLNHVLDELNRYLLEISEKIISIYTNDAIGRMKQKQNKIDPYIAKLNILSKVEFVYSKVVQNTEVDETFVKFPYIVMKEDFFHSCFDNGDFKKSCASLHERI